MVPERYGFRLDFEADGRWSSVFEGEVLHVDLYRAWQDGTLTEEDEDETIAEVSMTLEEQYVEGSSKYLGDGRFEIRAVEVDRLEIGKDENINAFLRVSYPGNGQIRVDSVVPDRSRLPKGVNSTGDVCISAPWRVVRHNASTAPSAKGECYIWKGVDILKGKAILFVMEP